MEKIFSRVNPKILLHVIHKKDDFSSSRNELSPEDQYIQANSLVFSKNKEVPAHKHLPRERVGKITQEALIVIEGEIEATYYDTDNNKIKKAILKQGDCTVTFMGGHSFKILVEGTKIYEIKNGPYYGSEKDKMGI